MKVTAAPSDFDFTPHAADLDVTLFSRPTAIGQGSAGYALRNDLLKQRVAPAPLAWDLVAIALSVISADLAGHRKHSTDGWTRQFELTIAVSDLVFWVTQVPALEQLLSYLSNDIWSLTFVAGGKIPQPVRTAQHPTEDCVVLLSGGLDSFIGVVDLAAKGKRPLAVSQTVRGDGEKQVAIATLVGGGLRHVQVNHTTEVPDPENPPTQRARSILFLAYGVFMATTLLDHQSGNVIALYVCENGLIALNPPLTDERLGSLSTRTTHPVVFSLLQEVLDAGDFRVRIENPYRFKTKGEMMRECADQSLLKSWGFQTTSCGRYKKYGYKHCGRCVPCLVRRAAFAAAGQPDGTFYVYDDLSIDDKDHAGFDDVRAALRAARARREVGTRRWLGTRGPGINGTGKSVKPGELAQGTS
jgi:hypothetical protein